MKKNLDHTSAFEPMGSANSVNNDKMRLKFQSESEDSDNS